MLTIPFGLYLISLILTLISGISGKIPLWIPVLIVIIGLMAGGYR